MNIALLNEISEKKYGSHNQLVAHLIYTILEHLAQEFSEEDLLNIKRKGAEVIFREKIFPMLDEIAQRKQVINLQ